MKYNSPSKVSTALFTLISVKIVYNIPLIKLLFIVHKICKISRFNKAFISYKTSWIKAYFHFANINNLVRMAKRYTVTVTNPTACRFRRYYSSLQHDDVIIVNYNYLYTLSIIPSATVIRVINNYTPPHPPKNLIQTKIKYPLPWKCVWEF